MAEKKAIKGMDDLTKLYQSFFVDMPLAGSVWNFGHQKVATEATWKGYDAAVRLTSKAIDDLYRSQWFGEMTAQSLDVFLRWQKAGTTLATALLSNISQAAGLPSATEVKEIREEVRALRKEIRALTNESMPEPDIQVRPKKPRSVQHTAAAPKIRRVA